MDDKVREALGRDWRSIPQGEIDELWSTIRAHIEALEAFKARCVGTYKGEPILADDPSVTYVMVNKADLDALQARVRELEGCIPTNWCDPLLTGPDAALSDNAGHWGCPDIERLLQGLRSRMARIVPEGEQR